MDSTVKTLLLVQSGYLNGWEYLIFMVKLRVKEIAEQKGYNMSSLSRKADVGFSTVKRIFQDPYREVTTTTLEKLAKALGVPTADLIEDVQDKEEKIPE